MTKHEFALIGPGRMGIHLSKGLTNQGWRCTAIRGRRILTRAARPHQLLECIWDSWEQPSRWTTPDFLFVCVPDRALVEVDQLLAKSFDLKNRVVFHTSGLEPASVLSSCRSADAAVASWHPLQSFPPEKVQSAIWEGVPCAIEGDQQAVECGIEAARVLGALPWKIDPVHKPRYHAAAAVAANLSHILIAEGARLLSDCGLPTPDGKHPLHRLVETSTQAALEDPYLKRLTGPLSRGDLHTVTRHIQVLPDPLPEVYKLLAQIAEKRLSDSTFV
jgi:predicted short-subunit dehydrogenase-like oxidoreductase (DUF2520 family)